MSQTPANGAGAPSEPQDAEFTSDEAVENAALAGAAAVQRIVAERNNLRQRVIAQQQELGSLHAQNEDLRRRLFVIHQRYVEVAKRVVGQLEQFDGTIREVVQDRPNGAASNQGAPAPNQGAPAPKEGAPSEAATLAQRLAATAAPGASGDDEDILEPDPES